MLTPSSARRSRHDRSAAASGCDARRVRRGMSAARATAIWAALAAAVALLFVASLSIGSVPMSPWQALASLVPHGGDALFADIVRIAAPAARARGLRMRRCCAGRRTAAGTVAQSARGAVRARRVGRRLLRARRDDRGRRVVARRCVGVRRFARVGRPRARSRAASWARRLRRVAAFAAHRRRDRGRWGALVTLLLSLAPDARLRGIIFWLTGDLNGVTAPWFAWGAVAGRLRRCRPRRN